MRKKPLREGKFSTFYALQPDDLIFQEFGRLVKYDCIHPRPIENTIRIKGDLIFFMRFFCPPKWTAKETSPPFLVA